VTATGTALDVEQTATATATVTAIDCNVPGRMTGGGSVFTDEDDIPPGNIRVTHGFEIHCDLSEPNRLEVNWKTSARGKENRFHLLELTSATCIDDPAIEPNPPGADFDTFIGTGTGRYNGVDGATIEFTFTDAGEPGTVDTATYRITAADGTVVLEVSVKNLTFGNHQAHAD